MLYLLQFWPFTSVHESSRLPIWRREIIVWLWIWVAYLKWLLGSGTSETHRWWLAPECCWCEMKLSDVSFDVAVWFSSGVALVWLSGGECCRGAADEKALDGLWCRCRSVELEVETSGIELMISQPWNGKEREREIKTRPINRRQFKLEFFFLLRDTPQSQFARCQASSVSRIFRNIFRIFSGNYVVELERRTQMKNSKSFAANRPAFEMVTAGDRKRNHPKWNQS